MDASREQKANRGYYSAGSGCLRRFGRISITSPVDSETPRNVNAALKIYMAKSEVYFFSPDPDAFAGFEITEAQEALYDQLLELVPLSKKWTPFQLKVDRSSGKTLGDFPCLHIGTVPVFSHRALTVLRSLISPTAEVLPLGSYLGEDYYIIHVLEEVNALDQKKAVFEEEDGEILGVSKYAFFGEKVKGKHIFHIPERRYLDPLVSADFKMCAEAHKLKGAKFRQVPQ